MWTERFKICQHHRNTLPPFLGTAVLRALVSSSIGKDYFKLFKRIQWMGVSVYISVHVLVLYTYIHQCKTVSISWSAYKIPCTPCLTSTEYGDGHELNNFTNFHFVLYLIIVDGETKVVCCLFHAQAHFWNVTDKYLEKWKAVGKYFSEITFCK